MSFINIHYSLTDVHTSQMHPLGSRTRIDGNDYIYLKGITGVDSTHNWVSFDEDHVTALLAANAKGRVGVFLGAVDANTKFGWAQIYGKCTVAGTDAVADNANLYIDGTAGRADDLLVSGDSISFAISRSTDASTNIATVELNYPYVNDKTD